MIVNAVSTIGAARFLDKLIVEDIGGGRFKLRHSLRFYSKELDLIVVAPRRYETDLASIPPYVPGWLVPKLGDYDYAAVIHDAAYDGELLGVTERRKLRISKAQADALFREGMEARGVNIIQRNAMYLAVKLFGKGKAWNGQGAA